MAYTSPSPVSSSPWFGPGSSPIISPSRWDTQVLDNLCILAMHNHSGSAGEGLSLDASKVPHAAFREWLSPFFPAASTSWNLELNTSWPGMATISTSTLGASIEYDCYLTSGCHGTRFFYGKGSSFGIITACLSGASTISSTSSVDAYASGAESPPTGSGALDQVGEFIFRLYTSDEDAASPGIAGCLVGFKRYRLKLGVTASNANSTGYIFRLGYMYLF